MTTKTNGFISVDEAIALIEKDTRKNATVDVAFLVRNLPYLRVNGNYTIKLQKHDNGVVVNNGTLFVQIKDDWEQSKLKHAIVEHYKAMSGREDFNPDAVGVKSLTTAVDEENNPTGKLSRNKKPMTKFGESTSGGSKNVEQ